ncbi:peptidoglycan DD-metalloendopeptidase family protein [Aliidiomarina soli]|uniref:Peptidase M23 n=1 Tax=Aliidiomarina soli TaxID=1928574 RepID=A0A432WDW6_9GAMM|nr:peptidoglycan DD-metalloendopeptidase family protein [Aliidiomarina soli]RUO31038.1 peptidase M23 [Aliidiomarina soli]
MTQFIHHLPRQHKVVIALILGALLLLALLPSEKASASRNTSSAEELELGKRYALELHVAALEAEDNELLDNLEWQSYQVRSGDSLARIFQRLDFSAQQLHRVTQAEDASLLQRIHPGDTLHVGRNPDGELVQLTYELNDMETLLITLMEDGSYASQRDLSEVEVRYGFANATISSSFWNAGVQAGLTQAQIMNLAELFGWDVDFVMDIRPGDHFSVIFEERFIDGEFIGTGSIVAAEFSNQGDSFQAIRHDNGNYYKPDGRNMRQAFLRAPVAFNRVSSDFNPRRVHPVTGQVRPHNGIDYAAATGTPVMAAGDGRVVESGYNNLNGNYVFIQHGERYVTKYLHLNRRDVQRGARVRQGQRIGTVGATGRVTGAHLHYEFLVNGVHRNPRTVDLPAAESLPRSEMAQFNVIVEQRLAQLESQRRVMVAMNDNDEL